MTWRFWFRRWDTGKTKTGSSPQPDLSVSPGMVAEEE
jgi:hypothetical protein